MKLDRGHDERGGGDGRDCKSKRDGKVRNSDNEVMCLCFPRSDLTHWLPARPPGHPRHNNTTPWLILNSLRFVPHV
jgi:hypothetical protein